MKTFIVTVVETKTIATEFEVCAHSKKEALENYAYSGSYIGDYVSSGKDRVEAREVDEDFGDIKIIKENS